MKKRIYKHSRIAIFFVALSILNSLGGCTVTEPQKVGEMSSVTQEVTQPPEVIFRPGEVAEMNDLQIALIGYKESNGSEWIKPADGKVFLLAEFEIVNNSNQDVTVSSVMSFDAYCDDYSLEYSFGATASQDTTQLDGTISPGKRMKGHIGWEVPTTWSNVEIHYTDDFWSDNKFKFLIEK